MGFEYYYDYDFLAATPPVGGAVAGAVGAVLGFLLVFYLLILAFGVLPYVLQSLGMYTIAKRRGIHNPWLAWLPVGNIWILGSISDQYQYVVKGRVRNRRKILVGLLVAALAVMFLMYAGIFGMALGAAGAADVLAGVGIAQTLIMALTMIVVVIIVLVIGFMAMYDLYRSCDPDNAVLYLVLSVFFEFLQPVLLFICRKKDGGMPPRKTVEQPQPILQTSYEPVEAVEEETPVQSEEE
jgi:uncharacterized membrane protein